MFLPWILPSVAMVLMQITLDLLTAERRDFANIFGDSLCIKSISNDIVVV